ncbi:MAG: DUF6089 family protein [Bacteroidota bacterium]|jgi:hypothetical protein
MRKSIFILSFIFTSLSFFSQRNDWKRERQEVIFGCGVSNFLGELGGKDRIGTDYSPADLEMSLTRPTMMLGYRYRLDRNWAVRGEFNFLRVWGDDKLTKEPFRNNRNLYFRSNIYELSANIEYAFIYDKKGNKYHIKHTFKRRYKAANIYSFIYMGISVFRFNPKAMYQGTWIALQPLGTEGQGLKPGTKKYARIAVAIPMGIGFKMRLTDQWTIGMETNYRITFTDYIDDCSTTYYDNYELLSNNSAASAQLADPNLGQFPLQLDENGKTRSGLQRGDSKQNDSFMSINITGSYILKGKRGSKKTRSKF